MPTNMTIPWGPMNDDSYAKQREAIQKAIEAAAKKSDSQVLKNMVKEDQKQSDEKTKMRCQMANRIFQESLDMYEEGDMTFSEMISDLTKALQAIE